MNRHRTTHAILAVIAFLLAAHLAVWLSGNEAYAQDPSHLHGPTKEPTVVGVSAEQMWFNQGDGRANVQTGMWKIVRAWSDGQVDIAQVVFDSAGGNDVDSILPPVVVIDPGP